MHENKISGSCSNISPQALFKKRGSETPVKFI